MLGNSKRINELEEKVRKAEERERDLADQVATLKAESRQVQQNVYFMAEKLKEMEEKNKVSYFG